MSQTRKAQSSNKWFTLIEILIAVAISALLMTSVMVFTWTTLKNNTRSQKILTSMNSNSSFEQKLMDVIASTSWSGVLMSFTGISLYESWIFLSTSNFSMPITFIWVKTSTWYCDAFWSSVTATWTIKKIAIKQLLPESTHGNTYWWYAIDPLNNSITLSSTRVIWTGNIWDVINEDEPLQTELSQPNAIIETPLYLYIADTWNNRILAYDKTIKKIKKILSQDEWLISPTDIYFTGSELYVANSWKWEILIIKDEPSSWNNPSFDFKLTKNISFNKIRITFDWISSVSLPVNRDDFTFSWITSVIGDSVSSWSSLTYSFTWWIKNLNSNTPYQIKINNLWPTPAWPGNYWAKIEFLSGGSLVYSENLPYLMKWDSSLYSSSWNIISKAYEWIIYPNNIIDESTWDDNIDDWANLLSNGKSKTVESELPINTFEYSINNSVLTIKYTYYKFYDCLNWKHILKEKIFKKKIN